MGLSFVRACLKLKLATHVLLGRLRAEPGDVLFFAARQRTPTKWASEGKDKSGADFVLVFAVPHLLERGRERKRGGARDREGGESDAVARERWCE